MKEGQVVILLCSSLIIAFCFLGAGYWPVFAGRAQAAEENPAEIIAAQIRKQGYSCDKALSAEKDREQSKPNEEVWSLKCDNAAYRVRLVPDKAAHVEPLE